MKYNIRIKDAAAKSILGMMLIYFVYILVWIGTKNILYEHMKIDNAFVRFFISDNIEAASKSESTSDKVEVDWKKLYPYDDPEYIPEYAVMKNVGTDSANVDDRVVYKNDCINFYISTIKVIREKADFYSSDAIPLKVQTVTMDKKIKKYLGYNYKDSDNVVFRLNNGYLTYEENSVSNKDISEIAASVSDFNGFLKKEGIPFLYVNAGSKVCPYDKQLGKDKLEYTNENGDGLIRKLKTAGVDTLDFRDKMIEDGLDWYSSYYITDHHWKNTTQVWAAGVLADTLNKDYGFKFDKKYFDVREYSDNQYRDYWYGCEGRDDAFASSSLEDFTTVFPKYKTNYTIKNPERGIDLTGDYTHTLFDTEQFKKIGSYSREDQLTEPDAYNCSRITNSSLTGITNNLQTDNGGKKILILQDSFGWYLTGYLASDIEKIDVMYPAFEGSIQTYIKDTKPDMVIMLCCERNISPIDWSTHTAFFDFR